MFLRHTSAVIGLMFAATAGAANCDSPKDEAETRACIAEELRQSDTVINDTYKKAMAVRSQEQRTTLRTEQRTWISDRTVRCGLDKTIADREAWIQDILKNYAKTACVVDMTRKRIRTLESLSTNSPVSPPTPPAIEPSKEAAAESGLAYDGRRVTVHTTGKWYFEFALNRRAIAEIIPTLIVMGVNDREAISGTMINITGREADSSTVRIGIAADFDNGKLYIRENGAWQRGTPGSSEGSDLKLGRTYYSSFLISAVDQRALLLSSGAFVPNFGDKPFVYAIPDGYSPWRNNP